MARVFGVDLARTGNDSSVVYGRDNYNFMCLERWSKQDIMQSCGRIEQLYRRYKPDTIICDADGLGAGAVDYLRSKDYPVVAFHGAARCERMDSTGELGFSNMRSFAWWNLKDLLDPRNGFNVTLPRDDHLISDLCCPRWSIRAGSLIQVESKDEIRKRLGRSPDAGDAAVYAFFDAETSNFESAYLPLYHRDMDKLIPGDKPPEKSHEQWVDEQLFGKATHRNIDIMSWD